MKFTAVGDFLVQEAYQTPYEGFDDIKSFIARGDVRFFNLETTLNREGACGGSSFSGGSYLRADPAVMDTAKSYGFNLMTNNNNHAFDFTVDGFVQTLKHLDESGIVYAGSGMDLPHAAAPAYLDTKNGRVALIAVCTSFHPCCMAGDPTDLYPGRPGINGLRKINTFYITAEQMTVMKQIAADTQINLENDIDRKDGYLPQLQSGHFEFGDIEFVESDRPHRKTAIRQEDLERVLTAIDTARQNADAVLISLHDHTMAGEKEVVPEFVIDFCHKCIEHGATAVIGHGPHLIRPVEIYHGMPIFYSLGDFVLQLNSIPSAPADFYEKHGVSPSAGITELLRVRSDNGKRGLMYDRKMMETFIPFFEIENGKLTHLELMPVELGFDLSDDRRGIPLPVKEESFMKRLAEISAPYGTEMTFQNGVMNVTLPD